MDMTEVPLPLAFALLAVIAVSVGVSSIAFFGIDYAPQGTIKEVPAGRVQIDIEDSPMQSQPSQSNIKIDIKR